MKLAPFGTGSRDAVVLSARSASTPPFNVTLELSLVELKSVAVLVGLLAVFVMALAEFTVATICREAEPPLASTPTVHAPVPGTYAPAPVSET